MKIAFDLDDVLLDVTNCFLKWYNQKTGSSFAYEDIKVYYYSEALGFSKEEETKLIHGFLQEGSLYEQTADPQAKETLARLSRDHQLYILTSRYTAFEKGKIWVEREFGDIFKSIIFKNRKGSLDDKNPPKWRVAQEQGIQVLVDDALHHLVSAAEKGLGAIVMDKPWNRKETPPGVLRAHNWEEIEKHVEKLEGKR